MSPSVLRISRPGLEFLFKDAPGLTRRPRVLPIAPTEKLSVCIQCQYRTICGNPSRPSRLYHSTNKSPARSTVRTWSSTPYYYREDPNTSSRDKHVKPNAASSESTIPLPGPNSASTSSATQQEAPAVHPVPDEDLPSHREGRRWTLSKKFSSWMDDLLPRLAVVSQQVNNYTGTDYSGIEALRTEIKEQEQLVKARRLAIRQAKEELDAAHAQQGTSQKEVVGLLERKHSWADTDLERYMSLIRSEHVNEQAVQAAKDKVVAAEQALEEARTRLEKRERAQYHEEQIWSDTIRRNSTWVTFGLMGVNILILLTSLVVLEPWRRRRMVREIRTALDEQKVPPAAMAASIPAVEAEVDAVVEPTSIPLESLETLSPDARSNQEPTMTLATTAPEIDLQVEATSSPDTISPQGILTTVMDIPEPIAEEAGSLKSHGGLLLQARHFFLDLWSERPVAVRKMDLTKIALEGAAAGAAIVCTILIILRSK